MTSTKRSVSFAPTTLVIHGHGTNDMTDEEIKATWSSSQERQMSGQDIIRNVQVMRTRPDLMTEERGLCERGIEHLRDPRSMKKRKHIKRKVINAVLDEQEYQWEKDEDDEERIRSASTQYSSVSTNRALHLASLDTTYTRNMIAKEATENITSSIDEIVNRAYSRIAGKGASAMPATMDRFVQRRHRNFNSAA